MSKTASRKLVDFSYNDAVNFVRPWYQRKDGSLSLTNEQKLTLRSVVASKGDLKGGLLEQFKVNFRKIKID
jgi:hypothetical protein